MNIGLSKNNLSVAELLVLRFEFEQATSGYNMPQGSDINTLEWFVENGHRSNSLRNGFDYAKQLAIKIVTEQNIWLTKRKNL